MSDPFFGILNVSSVLLLSLLPTQFSSNLLALHFVKSNVSVTCDRPSPTVLMTANNKLCDIIQESLFGKQEIFYKNAPL